jgi:hypothetical protein
MGADWLMMFYGPRTKDVVRDAKDPKKLKMTLVLNGV